MNDKQITWINLPEDPSDSDEPPDPNPRPARPWRVAVIANLRGHSALPMEGPADAGADFDPIETIQAIQNAIATDGHDVQFLPADAELPFRLRDFKPDICFNIAEGLGGDAREAQIPALLELLRIPYTASRVLTNAVALDKTMTKRIWREMGLPTANYQEFATGNEPLARDMRFPMFVKPAREGTGMGMDMGAIVHNETDLRRRVIWVIENYRQPALVEEYLSGREFTVGVLGRQDSLFYTRRPDIYGPDGFARLPVLEVDHSSSLTPGVYGVAAKKLSPGEEGVPGFLCPAPIDPLTAQRLQKLAIRAHLALGGTDVSRVDMRMDAQGRPRLLEINSLPGLTPDFSDLCVIGNAIGLGFTDLILEILYLGASRYGLLNPRRVAITNLVRPKVMARRSAQRPAISSI
ncbi:MAG TPA: hypothetical protein VFF78_07870 [Anaerolineaceae bacterium]|nr:hypothetical protein [Anaerolineaceae bacterium]